MWATSFLVLPLALEMKPHNLETIRLFNRLYYTRPFFWSRLPIRLTLKGESVHLAKSDKFSDTIAPLVLSFLCAARMGLAAFLGIRNPDTTPLGAFMVFVYQWFFGVHLVYFFLNVMINLGFGDLLIHTAALGLPYVEQLRKGKLGADHRLCNGHRGSGI